MTKLAPGYSVDKKGNVVIEPGIAYPEILTALGISEDKYDQYWLEVAYQCAKFEAKRLIAGTEHDPRPKLDLETGEYGPGHPLVIDIVSSKGTDGKRGWALADYPAGRGSFAATKGLEAKHHYRRWRGVMPE